MKYQIMNAEMKAISETAVLTSPMAVIIMPYKVVLSFESAAKILKCDYFKSKLLSSTFMWCCLLC